MPPIDRGSYLAALAKELRLTRKQQAFAERLAVDPERNQTRAAIAAGAGRGAAVTACKWLNSAKVQRYLQAMEAEAELINAKRTGKAVSSLQVTLEALTAIMRTSVGDVLKQRADGQWEVDPAALAAAPPGAFAYRKTRNGWSLRSYAGEAALALARYYFRGLRR